MDNAEMTEKCCSSNGNIMILTCSGASNVGQIANRVAVELTQEGFGKMGCLAGVGGHISGFVQSVRDMPLVAIDGCDKGCSRAVLEHVEAPVESYLVLTGLGFEKNKDLNLKKEEIDMVKEAVRKACGELAASAGQTSCCS